jgi:hypothetical protein
VAAGGCAKAGNAATSAAATAVQLKCIDQG